ncbi:MAG: methyltransferase domain-containing protein, partial [Patescibacteria group bacterium]|nr:methyltransferase domain-containing protein [Patescibacteria group bacterium]
SMTAGGNAYPITNGYPVLIPFEQSVLSEEEVKALASPISRDTYRGIRKAMKDLVSPSNAKMVEHLAVISSELAQHAEPARVLVVGGASLGRGLEPFYARKDIGVVAFDVYASPCVQFVADAHYIPVADACFDAVVVQMVLEHVLDARRVVSEIHRVLKPAGLVYATTPFLLNVHEGAYDFTRFTESGLRYLFKDFELIRSGALAGVGTQLLWALDGFGKGVFRSRMAGKLMKVLFCWLRRFDRLTPEAYNIASAAEVYFWGRKSEHTLAPKAAIDHYQGAQRK